MTEGNPDFWLKLIASGIFMAAVAFCIWRCHKDTLS